MKFWDSSALVPLLVTEDESEFCRDLLKMDPDVIVWHYTPTEILSALYRKARTQKLQEKLLGPSLRNLNLLREAWTEIIPHERIRERAHRLLAVHSLRAADSLQLASALVVFQEQPSGEDFVTFDENLALAASKEGFNVIGTEQPL